MIQTNSTSNRAESDPRIERTRRVVFDAACELVSDRGIGRVTVEGIAERCGVARSTIYRHWATLEELLVDALRDRVHADESPDTGFLRGDLYATLGQLAGALESPALGPIIASLIAESARDPDLEAVCSTFTTERRKRVEKLLVRGRERGELPPDTDTNQMAMDLGAAVFFRSLILRQPVGSVFVEATVDRWLANPPKI